MKILLDRIKGSPRPIRTSWDEDALNELAKSIAEQGVIVPIKVRPVSMATDHFEIVYGHRRVEAARRANLTEIEAIVEGVDDTAALVQALIENVQREDMRPLDKARALQTIAEETGGREATATRGIVSRRMAYYLFALLDEAPEIQSVLQAAPDALSEHHVRETRSVHDVHVRADALRKAADEQLNAAQTRAVAETVAKTQDPERRKALLETPYNQFVHNPEYAEANEQMARAAAPSPGEEFDRLPAIAVGLEAMKEFRKTMTLMLEACKVGKASPEARRFFARRIDGMIQFLTSIKEGLAE